VFSPVYENDTSKSGKEKFSFTSRRMIPAVFFSAVFIPLRSFLLKRY
jgi:hypothetical protein